MKCSSTKPAIIESVRQVTFQLDRLKRFLQCLSCVFIFNSSLAQNVGIGIAVPTEKLEVSGNIKGFNLLATGNVGAGTLLPQYRLHVVDGSIGMYNTSDNVTWLFNYNSATNQLGFLQNGLARLTLMNTGNVGIGNAAPAYKLDVNGSIHTETTATIDGNLTVNNGKGILQNAQGAGQLKYYTRTASFTVTNLAGFALSAEGAIGFTPGIFSDPPKVFVGDIVSTGGTLGELYRVQLIIYEVTTTGCKVRLLNTSPNPVTYGITWNIVCIGE